MNKVIYIIILLTKIKSVIKTHLKTEGKSRKKIIEIQDDESQEKAIEIQDDENQEKATKDESNEDENQEKEIEDESQDDENVDDSPDTSKKHGHDLDIIDTTRKTKKASSTYLIVSYSLILNTIYIFTFCIN